MLAGVLQVAAYAAACNLGEFAPALARYVPAATFGVFIIALKSGMGTTYGFLAAFLPAAVAVHLYTNKYSVLPNHPTEAQIAEAKARGVDVSRMRSADVAPPMVVENLYFPAMAGAAGLVGTSLAQSAGLLVSPPMALATYAIVAAHSARCVAFAAERMIYPAPIVSQFLIGDKDLAKYRAPIAQYIKSVKVHKTLGNAASPVVGTVEYAAIPTAPALGRTLSTGQPALQKQWVLYCGGNGEVFEASFPPALDVARQLNANLLVFNPRGVGRSTGSVYSAADLALDARTVVRAVIKEHNLSPDGRNFLLIGHSIGGGVAAELVAKELPEASVVFDRTFSTLTDACVALSPIKHEGLVRAAVPYIFGDFDVAGAYAKVAHSRKLVIFHREDHIIHYKGVSLGRLGASTFGGDAHLLELAGQTGDNHNSGFDKFSNYNEVMARIKRIV